MQLTGLTAYILLLPVICESCLKGCTIPKPYKPYNPKDYSGKDGPVGKGLVEFVEEAENFVYYKARQIGREVNWWDIYGLHPILQHPDYKDFKIIVETDPIEYGNPKSNLSRPNAVYEQWIHNSQPRQVILSEISKSFEHKNTYTWTVTAGLHTGLKTSVTASIPEVLKSKATVSMDVSLEKATTQTTTKTETLRLSYKIPVESQTKVKATWIITEQVAEIPWEANLKISGYIVISYTTPYEGKILWRYPVREITESSSKFTLGHDGSVNFLTKGSFKGVQTLKSELKTDDYPYQENTDHYLLTVPLQTKIIKL